MKSFISPNFTHEKLDNPTYEDLIDVFEDAFRNRMLKSAKYLLEMPGDNNNMPCGDISAVALMTGYFESIEIFITGKSSRGKSESFFKSGFSRVFSTNTADSEMFQKIAESIYDQVRCGFMHEGMFRSRVFFSRMRPDAILVTWPKTNGVFDQTKTVESLVINPQRFYECICIHFDEYITSLRNNSSPELSNAFTKAMNMAWDMNGYEPLIAMTEKEFTSKVAI